LRRKNKGGRKSNGDVLLQEGIVGQEKKNDPISERGGGWGGGDDGLYQDEK